MRQPRDSDAGPAPCLERARQRALGTTRALLSLMETHKSTDGASATARAGLERWEIDPTGSSLEFTLRHLIIQEIRGVFNRWGGTVLIDRQQPARSRVEGWIAPARL